MNRIDAVFANGQKAIMPFIVAGAPSLEECEATVIALDEAGADIIELGIPYSDPIADGPVISATMHRALEQGISPHNIVELVKRVRPKIGAGLIAMVSHSIVRKSGGIEFIEQLSESGIDGFIIPDIDIAEAEEISAFCRAKELSFSMLIAPTTPLPRVQRLAELSCGFLYVLARTGLTGEQQELPDLNNRISEIRTVTSLPLAVGFGISTAEHVKNVHAITEAAIVGSALVRRIDNSDNPADAARQFVQEIF